MVQQCVLARRLQVDKDEEQQLSSDQTVVYSSGADWKSPIHTQTLPVAMDELNAIEGKVDGIMGSLG